MKAEVSRGQHFMSASIHGFDDALKMLKQLPLDVREKELRGTIRVGANVVRKHARINLRAHARTGRLAKSLLVRTRRGRSGEVYAVIATARDSFYGMFLEFGTRFISPKAWLRNAADQNQAEIIKKMREQLKRRVEKLGRKYFRRR